MIGYALTRAIVAGNPWGTKSHVFGGFQACEFFTERAEIEAIVRVRQLAELPASGGDLRVECQQALRTIFRRARYDKEAAQAAIERAALECKLPVNVVERAYNGKDKQVNEEGRRFFPSRFGRNIHS